MFCLFFRESYYLYWHNFLFSNVTQKRDNKKNNDILKQTLNRIFQRNIHLFAIIKCRSKLCKGFRLTLFRSYQRVLLGFALFLDKFYFSKKTANQVKQLIVKKLLLTIRKHSITKVGCTCKLKYNSSFASSVSYK